MPPVTSTYPSTQQQLYACGRAAWQSCSDRLVEFAALRAKYTALFIAGKLTAIDAAEALPDDEQRKQVSVLLREQLSVKGEECRDFWQRLKLYIEGAYPLNEIPIQLNAAGQAHYTQAVKENWDSVKRIMIDGNDFITANSVALLAGANMPAGFAALFTTAKTEFETLYTSYINATLDVEVKTQEKITANNAVYDDLISMCKDGQRIFKNDEAVKNLFTYDQILLDIAGPGIAGLRGGLTDSVTGLKLPDGVIATISIFGTDHTTNSNAESRYEISPVAAGTYTIVIECPGYQSQQITNVVIQTGTLKTLNIILVPTP